MKRYYMKTSVIEAEQFDPETSQFTKFMFKSQSDDNVYLWPNHEPYMSGRPTRIEKGDFIVSWKADRQTAYSIYKPEDFHRKYGEIK